ncbi:PREDICTED: tumor necrosis factor ligand superfamily member 6-like [Thamnophis sirtalis]|uniref:Tumor necrosis factor ligand superfamily member 6-like n=1 Tax=Thamnophis sirtalis TaxID=35019 RepID=A0A6I9YSY1_9SAUR|nr:PREDICTED: tumor necrosis factor ligand superfamily member 6-like [Thamnophis sirtalis]
MHLSVMQHNQYCGYPQIFWTNNSSDCAPQTGLYHSSGIVADQDICLPLPVPARKRHRQNHRDGTRLCFLVVFLLILLAITGIGLAMFQIFHLQKQLQKFSSSGCVPPSPDMLKGALNRTEEKKVKRSAHLTGKHQKHILLMHLIIFPCFPNIPPEGFVPFVGLKPCP